MPFRDPAGQFSFDLSLGWAHGPERSHLITVYFKFWNAPGNTLDVRVMPTVAPPDVELDLVRRARRPGAGAADSFQPLTA